MAVWTTPRGYEIDEAAIRWTATRSGGPGGQHANTSDTAVEVTIDVAATGLHPVLIERIGRVAGARIAGRSADSRSQRQNRASAWERAAAKLDAAAQRPRARTATRPSRRAVQARLDDKRRVADRKVQRRRVADG